MSTPSKSEQLFQKAADLRKQADEVSAEAALTQQEERAALDPSRKHMCPRRDPNPGPFNLPEHDIWHEDQTCSYCGSLNPDAFMEAIEFQDAELTPTDKNYKVYITRKVGGHGKFYFPHLSEDQMTHFVELVNAKKVKLGIPGHFYVLPYFCSRKPAEGG